MIKHVSFVAAAMALAQIPIEEKETGTRNLGFLEGVGDVVFGKTQRAAFHRDTGRRNEHLNANLDTYTQNIGSIQAAKSKNKFVNQNYGSKVYAGKGGIQGSHGLNKAHQYGGAQNKLGHIYNQGYQTGNQQARYQTGLRNGSYYGNQGYAGNQQAAGQYGNYNALGGNVGGYGQVNQQASAYGQAGGVSRGGYGGYGGRFGGYGGYRGGQAGFGGRFGGYGGYRGGQAGFGSRFGGHGGYQGGQSAYRGYSGPSWNGHHGMS